MNLQDAPFNLIKSGLKKIELRLYDDKRKLISVGDEIEFSNANDVTQKILCEVIAIHKFSSFEELYKTLSLLSCDYTVENIEKTPRKNIKVYNKGKDREIVIRQDLSRELKQYYKTKKIVSGYIFLSNDPNCEGKMPAISTIWRQMKKVAGLARVNKDKVHPHNFRHLFAQVFLDSYPENVLDLADLLGHNDLKTTRIYTKTSGEQKRKKLENVKF